MQKLLHFTGSHLFIFFMFCFLSDRLKKNVSKIYVKIVLPMFSCRGFMILGLTFSCLIHFLFGFIYGVRNRSNFILFHVAVQLYFTTVMPFTGITESFIRFFCLLIQMIYLNYQCINISQF